MRIDLAPQHLLEMSVRTFATPGCRMHTRSPERWQHDHVFGQDRKTFGERRTWLVIGLTGTAMVVEIIAGLAFGSMALLADGVHMASHTMALGITAFAYAFTRRHAGDRRFSFGSGKINALGGFTSAVLLGIFAVGMAVESLQRLWFPVPISFNAAILVAFAGLVVNGASIFLLGGGDDHHDHPHGHRDHDHNLRSAYLHVLADTLTSVLAIVALLAGKFLGWVWLDPAMGIVGALLVSRWAYGLTRATGRVLLDYQAPDEQVAAVRQAIEAVDDNVVTDIHLWSVGPGIHALEATIVTHRPKPITEYRALLPKRMGIVHASLEVHACDVPAGS